MHSRSISACCVADVETAQKATAADPKGNADGPNHAGDKNIIAMHAEMLEQSQRQDLKAVYALLSEQILQRHQS